MVRNVTIHLFRKFSGGFFNITKTVQNFINCAKMSDFVKYTGEQYDAETLKKTFKEIKENASEQETKILPSMHSMQDELINEFTSVFQRKSKLNDKYFQLERQLDSMNTKLSLMMRQLSNAQDVSKKNNETVANLNEAIKAEEANIYNLTKEHYNSMMELADKFRKCHSLYDNEALKSEIELLDEETKRLYETKESKKIEMEKLREELERAKHNVDLDNLKTVLDGLSNLDLMKIYLQQTEQALDEKISKLQSQDNK